MQHKKQTGIVELRKKSWGRKFLGSDHLNNSFIPGLSLLSETVQSSSVSKGSTRNMGQERVKG